MWVEIRYKSSKIRKAMKVYEVLSFNKELLVKLSAMGIRCEDCKYIDLYYEYLSLRASGNKVTYIVATLSEKYRVSERQVYAVIDRLGSGCKALAVVTL